MSPADPGLHRLAQVAIVCRDIAASSARWAAVLGVQTPPVIATPPGFACKLVHRGQPSNARCKLAFFHLENITLELIEPMGGDSAWQEGLDAHGESVHHVAFNVKDLETTLGHFASLGIRPCNQGRYGSDDGTFVYLDSASELGAVVELLHNDPPSA